MKILKFQQVDSTTNISLAIEPSRNGPSNPTLPKVGELSYNFESKPWRYTEVANTVAADPANFVFEITQEEFAEDVKRKFDEFLAEQLENAYKQEKEVRNSLFGKYHESAAVAGVYKYEQAKAILADPTADAPEVVAEATARGVDVAVVAQRIVDNHEAFRLTEAKLAGLRGKIVDRLNSITFDAADPLGSWKELADRTEIIGTTPDGEGPAAAPPEGRDVVVGYYTPSLSMRWEWLNKG